MDMLSADPPSSIYGGVMDEPSVYAEGDTAARETAASLDGGGIIPQPNNSTVDNRHWNVVHPQRDIKNDSGVVYVPTALTDTQITLVQILLHLISETLIKDVQQRRRKTSIDSLLDISSSIDTPMGVAATANGDFDVYSRAKSLQLVSMCFNSLITVNNHPSLLVNHFMPKRLLLSQPNESQALMSGKFQFFNNLIDSILDRARTSSSKELYPVLVVAKNNKELELIEGLIIGKNLNYANSGNMKLYDDKRPAQKESAGEDADDRKGVFLHLIQTQQLYNRYMNKSLSSNFKFLFSFDSKIDPTNPSIQMLRSENACPIFVPVPVYSIEHLMLQIPEPNGSEFDTDLSMNINGGVDADTLASSISSPKLTWKLKLLNNLAVNFVKFSHEEPHNEEADSFYYDNYGVKMKYFHECLQHHPQRIADLFTKFNDELILNFSDDRLLKKLNLVYRKEIFGSMELGQPLTVDNFNHKFVQLLAFKLRQMSLELEKIQGEGKIHENGEHKSDGKESENSRVIGDGGDQVQSIGYKRLLTTSKQVHFDEDENTIAESYHKLRKLNNDANTMDRKLARVENDLHKCSEKDGELENKLAQLKSITEHGVSQQLLSNQSTQIENLEKELNDLHQEYDRLTNETEDLRSKYQQSSSEAVTESQKQLKLQKQLNKLTSKMQSPGMDVLPDLIHKDTLLTTQHRLDKLRHQNKFLETLCNNQVAKIVNERQLIIESSGGTGGGSGGGGGGSGGFSGYASAGSSSRPGSKISRDSTPFV
ncbi:HDA2 [Candida theae]|uniref:HDA2 n=1 Tax=Candida theae TaxID=1198502 RepID=A0AAD5FWD0_9ASCO|nr:HDA2 [Candida theae]KAI5948957.1 HDA2 [Candida theae]